MIRSKSFMGFVLMVIFFTPFHAQAESPISVKELLPAGEIHADILAPGFDEETQKLTVKFQEGIQKNREWFTQYMANLPADQPLGYHPNFGLTREEFEKVKHAVGNLSLVKAGTGTFYVEAEGDTILLKAEGALSGLNGLRIDLSANVLETPYGECRLYKPFVAPSPSALMPSGHEWGCDNGISEDQLKDIKFIVGKSSKPGKNLLWFKAREFSQDRQNVFADIMVEF